MTREQLEEIKKLAEAATPGPWKTVVDEFHADSGAHQVALIDRGENIVVVGRKLYQEIVDSMYVLHRQVEKLNKEKDTLSDALLDIAEGDCHYGDNCPTFGATRHGTCDACKARYALERAGIPLRSYVEDVP